MPVRTCWILAVAVGIASPLPALAQPVPTASDLFRLGRVAFDKGDYARALSLFRESDRLAPSIRKRANIGRTEARLGRSGSAMRLFREVLDQLPETDALRAAILEEVGHLGPKVPYLRVSLAPAAPPGTTVAVDAEPLAPASLGKDVPVDPGKHVVTAQAPGTTAKRYEVTVGEGGRGAVEAAPDPPPPQQDARPDVLKDPPRRVSPLVWAGFGAGGAGIVAGAVTGGLSWAETSTIKAHCPSHPCPSSQDHALSNANALANASNVAFGVGAAGAVVGIVGLVLSKPKAPSRVGLLAGPGTIGVRGVF